MPKLTAREKELLLKAGSAVVRMRTAMLRNPNLFMHTASFGRAYLQTEKAADAVLAYRSKQKGRRN